MKYLHNIAYATILAAAASGCAELPLSVRLGQYKADLDAIAKDGSVAKPAKTETGCTENEYSKLLELRKEFDGLKSAKKDKDDQATYDGLVARANAMIDAISANETVQAHLLIETRGNPQTKTKTYGAKHGEPLTLTGKLSELRTYITTADDALKVAQYLRTAKEMGYDSQPNPAELMENSVEVKQAKRKELIEKHVPADFVLVTQGKVIDKETLMLWSDGNRENGEIENMRLFFTVGGDTKVGEQPATAPAAQPTETAPAAQPAEKPAETAPAEQPVKSPLDRLPVPGENQPLPGEHK